MAKLIGTDPNQVPTNADLGTMAYQDYNALKPQLLAGGNRNLIINGGMTIAQRSTSSTQTGTGSSYVALDRWDLYRNSSFTPNITVSQSTDAPSGFLNSMKVDVDATDTPTTGENFGFRTKIEGLDTGRFNRRTASAENMTLSFYVKSNKTGTYSIQLFDMGGTIYSKLVAYTIDAADTWERKEITLQANTSGSNPTLSNSEGLRIAFDLGSGPDDVVPIFDWSSTYGGATRVASGQVNLLDSTSNYWQITGVQLEVGDTATPFEHRSYGDEIQRCMRYYQVRKTDLAVAQNSSNIRSNIILPVEMRATPTLGKTSGGIRFGDMVSFGADTTSTPTIVSSYSDNNKAISWDLGGYTSFVAYRVYRHEPTAPSFDGLFTLDAEL